MAKDNNRRLVRSGGRVRYSSAFHYEHIILLDWVGSPVYPVVNPENKSEADIQDAWGQTICIATRVISLPTPDDDSAQQ